MAGWYSRAPNALPTLNNVPLWKKLEQTALTNALTLRAVVRTRRAVARTLRKLARIRRAVAQTVPSNVGEAFSNAAETGYGSERRVSVGEEALCNWLSPEAEADIVRALEIEPGSAMQETSFA